MPACAPHPGLAPSRMCARPPRFLLACPVLPAGAALACRAGVLGHARIPAAPRAIRSMT